MGRGWLRLSQVVCVLLLLDMCLFVCVCVTMLWVYLCCCKYTVVHEKATLFHFNTIFTNVNQFL